MNFNMPGDFVRKIFTLPPFAMLRPQKSLIDQPSYVYLQVFWFFVLYTCVSFPSIIFPFCCSQECWQWESNGKLC